jgi:hypothetical protein
VESSLVMPTVRTSLLGLFVALPASAWAATVTVDAAKTSGTLARDAVGLSFEMRTVGEKGFDAATGNEAAIFSTLGIHNIRIGGNTVDYGTFWQAGGQAVPSWASIIIGPDDATRVAAFAKTIDAKVEWAVNLQHLDPALIDTQVGFVVQAFGDHLDSIQCGNEPNGFFGGYAQFKTSFDSCKTAIKGRAKISGPDTYGGGGAWNAGFANDEAPVLDQLNYHFYSGGTSIGGLLGPGGVSGALSAIQGSLTAAKAHNLAYRTDETNSKSLGGTHGVSDVYASALWAMHYALASAEKGAGTNFHGFLGVCGQPTVNGKNSYYTPICAASKADEAAKMMTAAPEYYGLWMAAHMGPGQFQPVTVAGAANLVSFAVKGDDGATRIALIEKSATGTMVPVSVAGTGDGAAEVIHMTGPALNAPSGVMIQGSAVDRDGKLALGAADKVTATGGMLALMIPSGSAAIVTLGGSTPGQGSAPPPPPVADGGEAPPPPVDAGSAPPPVDAGPAVTPPPGEPTPPAIDAAAPVPAPPASGGGCHCNVGQRGRPSWALLLVLGFAVVLLRRSSARSR